MWNPLILAIAVFVICAPAKAAILYSTLGPGETFNCCHGFYIGGTSGGSDDKSVAQAAPFSTPFPAHLERIDLALTEAGDLDTAAVRLWRGNAAGLPGTVLASWTVSGFAPFGSTTTALVTIDGIKGVNLWVGSRYFISVEPVRFDDFSQNFWNYNVLGLRGEVAHGPGGSWWHITPGFMEPLPAFAVSGTAPEPATLGLVLAGFAVVWARRKRRTRSGHR